MTVAVRFGPDPADYPRAKARARALAYLHSLGYSPRGELAQAFADGYADFLAAPPPGVGVGSGVAEPGWAVRWNALAIPVTSPPAELADNPDELLWSVRIRYIAQPGQIVTTTVRGLDAAAAADNARLLAAPNVVRVLEVRSATAGPLLRLLHLLARLAIGT